MLIDWVRSGRTGEYLTLGPVRASHSVNTYEFGIQGLGLGKCLPFRLFEALFVDDSVESCLTRCRFKHQLFSIFGNYELENRLLAPLEAIIFC